VYNAQSQFVHEPRLKGNEWHSDFMLLQVRAMSSVAVPTASDTAVVSKQAAGSDRFSLFSHFPVSNGGSSCSGLGGLQTSHSEQPKCAGYQLFGSSSATFPSVSPMLPVSLY